MVHIIDLSLGSHILWVIGYYWNIFNSYVFLSDPIAAFSQPIKITLIVSLLPFEPWGRNKRDVIRLAKPSASCLAEPNPAHQEVSKPWKKYQKLKKGPKNGFVSPWGDKKSKKLMKGALKSVLSNTCGRSTLP